MNAAEQAPPAAGITTDLAERLKYGQWVLERNLAWITQAEAKVAVVVTLNAGMIGAAAAAYTTTESKTVWAVLLSLLFGVLAVISLLFSAMAVRPMTKGPQTSFIFFGAVSAQSAPNYVAALLNATDAALLEDLAAQIHRNAEIAAIKHDFVKKAVRWAFLATACWIGAVSQLVR